MTDYRLNIEQRLGDDWVPLAEVVNWLLRRAAGAERRGDDPSISDADGSSWHVRAFELRDSADALASWATHPPKMAKVTPLLTEWAEADVYDPAEEKP